MLPKIRRVSSILRDNNHNDDPSIVNNNLIQSNERVSTRSTGSSNKSINEDGNNGKLNSS